MTLFDIFLGKVRNRKTRMVEISKELGIYKDNDDHFYLPDLQDLY